MTVDDQLATAFVETGLACHEHGVLPDALLELSIRLELAGAGDLIDKWTSEGNKRRRYRRRWLARRAR